MVLLMAFLPRDAATLFVNIFGFCGCWFLGDHIRDAAVFEPRNPASLDMIGARGAYRAGRRLRDTAAPQAIVHRRRA
jgi:hypothetical protein